MKIKERGFSKPDITAWFPDIFKLKDFKTILPSEEGYKEPFPTKYYLLIEHKRVMRGRKESTFLNLILC